MAPGRLEPQDVPRHRAPVAVLLDSLLHASKAVVDLPDEAREGREYPGGVYRLSLLPDGGEPFLHLRHHRLAGLEVCHHILAKGAFVISLDVVEGVQRVHAGDTELAALVADARQLPGSRDLRADPGQPASETQQRLSVQEG